MKLVMLYVTTPDRDVALNIGRSLVTARLAACANILDQMTSIYRWDNQLQESNEVVLLLKTREELTSPAVSLIQQLHPYNVPAILVLPVNTSTPLFTNWIFEETLDSLETDSPIPDSHS